MPLEFRPKLDKIVQLLLYLSEVRPNADKYQAVKFLYLADKEHLNRHGRPITHEAYFALPFGPVASNAMDMLEGDRRVLTKLGLEGLPFKTEEVARADKKKPLVYIREPLQSVDRYLFSKSDLTVFDDIISRYGDLTFDELFKITHKHKAYVLAWGSRRPGSSRAPMNYLDMIENDELRTRLEEDLSPVSAYME